MSTATYEDKRKCQNREAQRRYRQKMRKKKKGGALSVDNVDATITWPTVFDTQLLSAVGLEHQACFTATQDGYNMASYSPNGGDASILDSGTLQSSPSTKFSSSGPSIDLADMWTCTPRLSANPVQPVEGSSPACADQSTPLIQASPATTVFDLSESRPSSSESRQEQAADCTGSAHAKLVSKACGMVQELRKLYDLGVELDLLQHESDVPAHLDAVEQLMHSSGRRCSR